MKVKTSELQRAALNWAVAKAEGKHLVKLHDHFSKLARHSGVSEERLAQHLALQPDVWVWLDSVGATQPLESYCEAWAQGGPIIEREKISTEEIQGAWKAELEHLTADDANYRYGLGYGPTPLIAAMRCYVASKLGDEVEIPEELL
jgi:hypothetical protein